MITIHVVCGPKTESCWAHTTVGYLSICIKLDWSVLFRSSSAVSRLLPEIRRFLPPFRPTAIDKVNTSKQYVAVEYIDRILDRELKKGSAELLVLSLVEHRARHGYEISQVIEDRSQGAVRFRVASLYPLLYRLEKRGWITGRWVEKAGQRRRRYYRLTAAGRKVLAQQRSGWEQFVAAVNRIAEA